VTRPPANPLVGWWRLARVAGLGLSTYGLAVGAHVAAGGGWPGWPISLMLAALLGVSGVALTTRRRGLPTLLAVLAVGQTALHVLFTRLDSTASCGVTGLGHHATAVSCGPPTEVGSAGMAMPSLPMLVAHLAATAATAWLLARGEAWLWRTLRSAVTTPDLAPIDESAWVPVVLRTSVRSTVRRTGRDAPRGPPRAAPLFVS
jgi:hypothetical protein